MKAFIGTLAIGALLVGPVSGNSWHVATTGSDQASGGHADPFLTIQHGIDMAADGDSVLVHDGTYTGDGNRDIDFLDKKIVVMSISDDPMACIIQCGGSPSEPHRGVLFDGLEDPLTVLRGFTITGGYADEYGGGILFTESGVDTLPAPVLENCVLTENTALKGAGFAVFGLSHPIFRDCQIVANDGPGGGWYPGETQNHTTGGSLVDRCRFAANTVGAEIFGGDFLTDPWLRHCEFHGNQKNGFDLHAGYGSALLDSCEASDNHGWGLHLIASVANAASSRDFIRRSELITMTRGCVVLNNGLGGIWCQSEDGYVRDCRVQGNQGPGVLAGGTGWWEIRTCIVVDNTGVGIDVGGALLECYDNIAYHNGAAGVIVGCCGSSANVHHNLSHHNGGDGLVVGGQVYKSITVRSNTIVSNSGHGIAWSHSDSTVVHDNLVAFNGQTAFSCAAGDPPDLACSDFFGNLGGDWVGCISDQVNLRGNFSADPCFCDSLSGNYTLCADSWCLPGLHPWGCDDLVGAYEQGCEACDCAEPGPSESTSWGSTKVLYR